MRLVSVLKFEEEVLRRKFRQSLSLDAQKMCISRRQLSSGERHIKRRELTVTLFNTSLSDSMTELASQEMNDESSHLTHNGNVLFHVFSQIARLIFGRVCELKLWNLSVPCSPDKSHLPLLPT